jgi:hypothetical protein
VEFVPVWVDSLAVGVSLLFVAHLAEIGMFLMGFSTADVYFGFEDCCLLAYGLCTYALVMYLLCIRREALAPPGFDRGEWCVLAMSVSVVCFVVIVLLFLVEIPVTRYLWDVFRDFTDSALFWLGIVWYGSGVAVVLLFVGFVCACVSACTHNWTHYMALYPTLQLVLQVVQFCTTRNPAQAAAWTAARTVWSFVWDFVQSRWQAPAPAA